MAKNEKSSKSVSSLAGRALPTGKASPSVVKKLAASVLTQAADKGGKKVSKKGK